MACKLFETEDIKAVYSLVYGEIKSRINNSKLPKFDNNEFIKFTKNVYKELKDVPNGLLYVQALPDILIKVADDEQIRKYLRSADVKFKFDPIYDMSDRWDSLDNVLKDVSPKAVNKSKKEIDKDIKNSNINSQNIDQKNDDDGAIPWSSVQEKAKVDVATKTTDNIAIAKNPEKMTEAERNAKDPEKKLYDKVIKNVIWLSRNRGTSDNVMLGDIPLMLRAQSIRSLNLNDLTKSDVKYLKDNPNYNVNVAIVSDTKGNPIRFDENGNVDQENGKIVYQFIRPVINYQSKLYLGNRAGYLYTLIPAEELAKRKVGAAFENGEILLEDERGLILNEIKQQQIQSMNDVANLNTVLESDQEYVLLPITGGSYGIVEHKSELLSNTDFKDDVDMLYIIDSGENEGVTYFITNKVSSGVAVDNRVYLQRMDMDEKIARNIAKVLTSKGLLDGEELTPQAKLAYYETFLSDRTKGNRISASIENVLGQNVLSVSIYDPKTKQSIPVDLNDPASEQMLVDHLLKVKQFDKKDGTVEIYPASMSYMKTFAVNGVIQKGVQFTDYQFTTSKSGTEIIKEVKRDYFEYIKPYMKVDYASEGMDYFAGINSYLSFSVPEEVTTDASNLIDIGIPGGEKIESDDLINDEIEETEDEADEVEGVQFKLTAFSSTLPNEKVLKGNISKSDIVLGLGTDFTTKDEKFIENTAAFFNKWHGVKIGSKKNISKDFKPSKDAIDMIVKNMANIGGSVVNVIGNDISVLEKNGYTQADIDKYIYNILSEIVKQYPITELRSNGQTGIAEASIKAAKRLGIPVMIVAYKNYQLRTPASWLKVGYQTNKNTRAQFLSRFYPKRSKALKTKLTRKPVVKEEPVKVPKAIAVKGKTITEEEKEVDVKINTTSIDDLLDGTFDIDFAERNKRQAAVMDKLFGGRSNWKEVDRWFDNSPLKGVVAVERLAGIFNSTAYGTFMTAGSKLWDAADPARKAGFKAKITLYGDATALTLYHEAWHAFSQLALSRPEKTKLYETVRSYSQWANKSYMEIEEDLAEGFIEYLSDGKKRSGFIQTIYDKLKKLLEFFFGKTSNRDVTRLYDIPLVKEYYEKLHTGRFTIDTLNAENNVMPGFQKLNSEKNLIKPLKQTAPGFAEFTDVESNKIVDLIDRLMARTFYQFNIKSNTTAGAVKLLSDVTNRQKLYTNVERQLNVLLENQRQKLEKLYADDASGAKDLDPVVELKEKQKFDLLFKTVENYGVVGEALSKQTNEGVVAFHMQKSRFSIIKEAYEDDIEDATTALFTTKEGNSLSAKQLATDDTLMMLSGIYSIKRDDKGEYLKEIDEDGAIRYTYDTDEFGLAKLEPLNDMWNRLARTLQGSLDYLDMYDRIKDGIKNNPEFIQVLAMLPNPYQLGPGAYNNTTEFSSETNFWQDLKKPVIPYIQLNVNKIILEKAKMIDGKRIPEKSKFESRLAPANFDVYKIINEWRTNFNIADPTTNPYVSKDLDYGFNYLNVDKIIADFSLNKRLDPSKVSEFLAALGIQMDITSPEIRAMLKDTKKPFASRYNIDYIYNNIRLVYLASKSNNLELINDANKFKKDPMLYLLDGLPSAIQKESGGTSRDVKTKITTLAQIQNKYSDGYSNFSVLTPEKNRVWEQFLDNTITRVVTSINKAKTWQQLTMDSADPNGRFLHMRWLNEANNPSSAFSVVLNSIFDLDQMSETYGQKFPEAQLLLENIGGTQVINRDTNDSIGASTATMDVTSKFLQELHTMLQSGVQEFMRHASKQTAMNLRAKDLKTYSSKKLSNLYVDIMAFSPNNTVANNNEGESEAFKIILGYIAAEAGRIYRYKSNPDYFKNFSAYNRDVVRRDNNQVVAAGEAFTAFDDVLTPETQGLLYDLIDQNIEDATIEMLQSGYYNTQDFNLKDLVNENPDLRKKIKEDVIQYFNKQARANYSRLEDARYVDQSLYDMVSSDEFSKDQIDMMLVKAYTYNSWIHNFETTILAYGDTAQYNHDKEEFHKRNAGLGSGGRGFRADYRARMYINSPLFERLYAQKEQITLPSYNGTLTTAIIKEEVVEQSKYKPEYEEELIKDYTARFLKAGKSKAEASRLAKELTDTVLGEYDGMKIADGQGWISFESYRMLKNLEGNWTKEQEDLYRKVVAGKTLSAEEVKEFFPSYKVQYFGNIKSVGLPVTSFHKFSLAPIIPTVHTAGTKLGQIHRMMMEQGVDYILMETGEKVGHIGSGDKIIDDNGNVDTSVTFTKNIVFADYLKNQTEVNSKYKEKSIFSTQMRKMILEGLYENGEITSKDPAVRKLVNNYVNRVGAYTELLKNQLIDELGFEETEDGEYIPVDKDSLAKLAKLIRETLTRDDVYSDKLIDIIDVTDEGELRFDLSLHPEAAKIEKLLLSVINKRIIKQKVKGEPLVQKSSAFYDGLFELPIDLDKMNDKARDAAVKKYMGSNFLPTYHKGADGKTTAMKVAISLQGDYESLLNLEYKGEPIETLERLNQAIKDDEWLDGTSNAKEFTEFKRGDFLTFQLDEYQVEKVDYDSTLFVMNQRTGESTEISKEDYESEFGKSSSKSTNREAITMVGVRIPVQGLNSMEFMEVYHFLPAEAGNVIIPPPEIVAKSGADFDIDKLSIFMTSLDPEGNVQTMMFEKPEDFYEALEDPSKYEMTKEQMYAAQKAGFENELINDIRSILELPQNFVSLITPNGTYLVKPIADQLAEYVMDYNPLESMMNLDEQGNSIKKLSAPDKKGKQKEVISPTRIFEVGYNLYKHESNVVGKRTLGLGAIENTFNVIFNSLGAVMPAVYRHSDEEIDRVSFLGLRHHTTKKDGQDVISLSKMYDVDGVNKVADIISQLMNGWVDVEKDAWVFFVQGNYEVAPILLYLLKAGVPVKEAVYFVSQPLVREYVKEKRLIESTFAEPLRKSAGMSSVSFKAASNVIAQNFSKFLADDEVRYTVGAKMYDAYFDAKGREGEDRHFTEKEMLDLIKNFKTDPKQASSALSKTMFLHYLTIEKQIQGITQLKMAANPDTALLTDVGQAIQAESNIADLAINSKIDQDLRTGMLYDSVISSFFNTKLIKGLSKPLFKFRYDDMIQTFIEEYMSDFENSKALRATFGRNYRDKFPVVFRNDVLSYIFQNAMRKYSIGKEYSSYTLSESLPIQEAAGLKFGAAVIDTKDGKKIVIDKVQIEKEFYQKAYLEGSEAQNSYEDRGLYPLKPGHFGSNTSSNKQEYIRFVIEREYLRSVMPIEEVSKTKEFKSELEKVSKTMLTGDKTKLRRYAYEKIITGRALDNTLNPYQLFHDPNEAYAVRFENIRSKYRNDFVTDYPVLARFAVDSNYNNTMFNLYVDDKDMTTFKSNMYTRNLEELSNRNVEKVSDPDENNRISDFFAKITYVAMMQAGTNKSKYNFLNLTDFEGFIELMNAETAKFLQSPAKAKILLNFKNKFEQVNSQANKDRFRFKNYLTSLDVAKSEATMTAKIPDNRGFSLSIDKKGKDQGKADLANRFIGYGVPNTSTYQYELDAKKAGIAVNYEGVIDETTVAFVSVNGNGKASEKAIDETIENAREVLEAGGTVIMDSTEDANRSWNKTGEALVQEGLGEPSGKTSKGYNYWGIDPELTQALFQIEANLADPTILLERKNLIGTINPNVFVYNDLSGTEKAYESIVDANQDITFVYQFSLGQKQAIEKMTEAEFNAKKIKGNLQIKKFANSSSIGIITGQDSVADAFSTLDPKYYPKRKAEIDKAIAEINDVINRGGKVAFSMNGYGDPTLMPEELFVYLSKQLFENFQYLNPGSEFSKEVSSEVSKYQPVTDAEILAKFEGENNPLNCM